MLSRIAIFVVLAATACISVAQDSGWVQVAVSQDGNDVYSVKLHSGERSATKGGVPIIVVVGQVEHKLTGKVDLNKWYVTDSDCNQGYGYLDVTDMDGNFIYEAPFAQGGKNIASAIATDICAAGKSSTDKNVNSGLSS